LGAGQVPASAYETAAGTKIAKRYLAAIGQPAVAPTEEVPEITPTEAPAITPAAGGVYDPATGRRYRTPTDVVAPTLGEPITMAGLTGAAIGPQQPLGPPGQPSPITLEPLPTTAVGAAPSIYPERPDLPEGAEPGQYVMGAGSPWGAGIDWGGVVGIEGGLTGMARAMAPDILGAAGVTPEAEAPYVPIPQEMPPARYPYGTTSAAWYTGQALRAGQIPDAVSADVASILGMNTQLLQNSGYVWDEASGLWQHRPEVAETTTTTGYAGGGRRIQFARRGVGGGQSPYGTGFKSNLSGLINWRRAFGG